MTTTKTKIFSTVGLVAAGAVSAAAIAGPAIAAPAKLSHDEAARQLSAAGISWSSSGNCSERSNPRCTSFEQVNQSSITQVISFKNVSGCTVVITGGTETGHASGTFSHFNGYKLDIRKNECVNGFIIDDPTNIFTPIGGRKYRSPHGDIYFDEDSRHWDVQFQE